MYYCNTVLLTCSVLLTCYCIIDLLSVTVYVYVLYMCICICICIYVRICTYMCSQSLYMYIYERGHHAHNVLVCNHAQHVCGVYLRVVVVVPFKCACTYMVKLLLTGL